MKKETITEYLIKVLMAENPGKLFDEAEGEARAVMMYYEQVKKAEIMYLNE